MSFFQPKLGLIWKFFPSGAQKSQTVLQERIPRLVHVTNNRQALFSPVHNLNICGVGPETVVHGGEGDPLGPQRHGGQHHVRADKQQVNQYKIR